MATLAALRVCNLTFLSSLSAECHALLADPTFFWALLICAAILPFPGLGTVSFRFAGARDAVLLETFRFAGSELLYEVAPLLELYAVPFAPS